MATVVTVGISNTFWEITGAILPNDCTTSLEPAISIATNYNRESTQLKWNQTGRPAPLIFTD